VPIVIALVVATVVGATLIGVLSATRHHHHHGDGDDDPGDLHGDPARLGAAIAEHSALKRFLLDRRDPRKETGLLLTVAVVLIAGAILSIGALLMMVRRQSGFARWDAAAARFGARHASSSVTNAMEYVTELGSSTVAVGLAVTVGAYSYARTRRPAIPAYLLTTVLTTMAANNVVKWIVDRPRPDLARIASHAGSSFPSGHTATAAATYAALALVLGRGRSRPTKGGLVAAAAGITAGVAASRVLLGVHWVTDVAAGTAMGWSCFAVCSVAFGGRALQFGRPVVVAQQAADHVEDAAESEAAFAGNRAR
jgi:membrane-associated phospholipid phosphatase